MKMIQVIIKRPGEKPKHVMLSNTLKAMQEVVGGYIETFTFAEEACIICNSEGKLEGLPFNVNLFGEDFAGTIIFAGIKGDEFADFNVKWDVFKFLFSECFEVKQ